MTNKSDIVFEKLAAKQKKNMFGMTNKQRDFVAGTVAGAGATAAFYPLDAIVTSQQSGTWSKKVKTPKGIKMKGFKHDLKKMTVPKKLGRLYLLCQSTIR